jgi:hypothetical protein
MQRRNPWRARKASSPIPPSHLGTDVTAEKLFQRMKLSGFRVSLWRERRIYVQGHGRDIRAYIEPVPDMPNADGARIVVESTWRSPQNALRCKSIKHAILSDLFEAELLTTPPPESWRDVRSSDRPTPPPRSERHRDELEPFEWPEHWPLAR